MNLRARASSLALLLFFFLLSIAQAPAGDVWVKGHTRKNGTHVQGHYRSSPDGVFSNNWSTIGNVNPHTGKVGTRTHPSSGAYSSGSSSTSGYLSSTSDLGFAAVAPTTPRRPGPT